jgi:hypothetical protein
MYGRAFLFATALGVICVDARLGHCDGPQEQALPAATPDPQSVRRAIERGLVFLKQDAAEWREERECSTCHHGTMTVWAYSEAKSRGYDVDAETVADTLKWTKDRLLARIDLPRDTRPGWSMVNTPAIYLAVMAQCVPEQEAVSADELERIAGHLLRHQETDGCWAWSSAPPQNRPPPVFESDEVATRLAYMALEPRLAHDAKQDPAVRDSLEKAAAWLAKTEPSDTTQAAALRLLMKVRAGVSAEPAEEEIAQFLQRQNADGGWAQLEELPSDAYATGQSLYVLSLAGVNPDRPEVQRAVAFLLANQREDGFWPMKSRAHPGATPYKNPVPITYFGSAWATLGLLRTQPTPSAAAK